MYYTSWNICKVLWHLCFLCNIDCPNWFVWNSYPYSSGFLHWHGFSRAREITLQLNSIKNVYCPTNAMAQVKTHTCRHIRTRIHTCTHTRRCAYICIQTNIYINIHTYTYTFAPTTINWIMLKHIDSNNINGCGPVRWWWLVHVGL